MSKSGSGVRVAHDLDDFLEDHEVVLTLKDQGVLDADGVNIGDDVLENSQMAQEYKRQAAVKHQKKIMGLSSYDDDMENDKRSLLPQYDEVKTEKVPYCSHLNLN